MLSEYGGVAFVPEAAEPYPGTWGYSGVETAEAFAAIFEDLLDTVIQTALFSGFCYTQFADTFQESNGLLTADRTPKIPLERIALATTASRSHIPHGV